MSASFWPEGGWGLALGEGRERMVGLVHRLSPKSFTQ